MTYNLSITKTQSNTNERSCYVLPLANKEDCELANLLCRDDYNMAGKWKAFAMPIRTDLTHFISDVLFPVSHLNYSFYHSLTKKTHHFAQFIALVCDLWSIPLRLLTLFPRACYNALNTRPIPHPLSRYLREKKVDPFYQQGEVEVRVYEVRRENGKIIQYGHLYDLHLADHEVPCMHNMTRNFKIEQKA
ncbi:MAG: hypothetical protein K2X08_07745 [Chlamydiales bacterium]|nr:hypothetical protein [Chlamydiales bacterium]MBY0529657.1 hypothetical protein [Rhabdochlamydiaceae bacterium]